MRRSTFELTERRQTTAKLSHRVVVLAEGNDLGVVFESLSQSQLGDGFQGKTQQVGAQWDVLTFWEGPPLSHQLLCHLEDRITVSGKRVTSTGFQQRCKP